MKNLQVKMREAGMISLMAMGTMPLFFTSCSSNSDDPVNGDANELTEIRLASSIATDDTRAWANSRATLPTATTTQSTQLYADEQVTVVIYDTPTSGSPTHHVTETLTADGSGNLSGNSMYYPLSGNDITLYAIHGKFTSTVNTDLISSIEGSGAAFSVATDQSENADYLSSDLLYTKKANIKRSSDAVHLSFTHQLSRVQVDLSYGDGIATKNIESVYISGAQSTGTYAHNGTQATITVGTEASPADLVLGTYDTKEADSYQAIVVPQSMEGKILNIKTTDGGVFKYTFPSKVTYTAGNAYTYKVKVSATGLTITTEITAWGDGGTTNDIEAIM